MKIKIPFDFDRNVTDFLQKAGYAYVQDYNATQQSFSRRLSGGRYPRFHIYINEIDNQQEIDLHLDQKAPSYAGSSAHSGEYDGPAVESEIERIKAMF